MTVRIGINGFGRIGRMVVREAAKNSNVEIVAINDLVPSNNLAYLLKYDSTHGRFNGEVVAGQNSIGINGKNIECLSEKNPANLPWIDLNIDYVIESTGLFTDGEKAAEHLKAGAKKLSFQPLQSLLILKLWLWELTTKTMIQKRTILFQMLLVQQIV